MTERMSTLTKFIQGLFTPKLSDDELIRQGRLIRLRCEAEERELNQQRQQQQIRLLRLLEEEKKLKCQKSIIERRILTDYIERVVDLLLKNHSIPSHSEVRDAMRDAFFEGVWFYILDAEKPNAIKTKNDEGG